MEGEIQLRGSTVHDDLTRPAVEDWYTSHAYLTSLGYPVHSNEGVALTLRERIELIFKSPRPYIAPEPRVVTIEYATQAEDIEPIEPSLQELVQGPKEFKLTDDQQKAWDKILHWLVMSADDAPYFILRGFAGTGKTHLMKMLKDLNLPNMPTVYFTAPTNKAARVLRDMLGTPTKTIHSLLGLRMSTDSEDQELVFPERLPELSRGCIIVIDEGFMVNTELVKFVDQARMYFDAKVMYVGDPAQLPPVGEDHSPCGDLTKDKRFRAFLKKVMRFDNQLLKLATHLRECVLYGGRPKFVNDNNGDEGVFVMNERDFLKKLLKPGATPDDYINSKMIAWRNRTVNEYNALIRKHLGFTKPFEPGDLLMVAAPIELNDVVAATIDEDMTVTDVRDTIVQVKGYDIPVHELVVRVVGGPALRLNIPTEEDEVLPILLSEMADKAKRTKDKVGRRLRWKEFWEVKNKFHKVRYGYAFTSHRAQGSTYETVFVDKNDILSNHDHDTANRCAYVGFTRASKRVYTF